MMLEELFPIPWPATYAIVLATVLLCGVYATYRFFYSLASPLASFYIPSGPGDALQRLLFLNAIDAKRPILEANTAITAVLTSALNSTLLRAAALGIVIASIAGIAVGVVEKDAALGGVVSAMALFGSAVSIAVSQLVARTNCKAVSLAALKIVTQPVLTDLSAGFRDAVEKIFCACQITGFGLLLGTILTVFASFGVGVLLLGHYDRRVAVIVASGSLGFLVILAYSIAVASSCLVGIGLASDNKGDLPSWFVTSPSRNVLPKTPEYGAALSVSPHKRLRASIPSPTGKDDMSPDNGTDLSESAVAHIFAVLQLAYLLLSESIGHTAVVTSTASDAAVTIVMLALPRLAAADISQTSGAVNAATNGVRSFLLLPLLALSISILGTWLVSVLVIRFWPAKNKEEIPKLARALMLLPIVIITPCIFVVCWSLGSSQPVAAAANDSLQVVPNGNSMLGLFAWIVGGMLGGIVVFEGFDYLSRARSVFSVIASRTPLGGTASIFFGVDVAAQLPVVAAGICLTTVLCIAADDSKAWAWVGLTIGIILPLPILAVFAPAGGLGTALCGLTEACLLGSEHREIAIEMNDKMSRLSSATAVYISFAKCVIAAVQVDAFLILFGPTPESFSPAQVSNATNVRLMSVGSIGMRWPMLIGGAAAARIISAVALAAAGKVSSAVITTIYPNKRSCDIQVEADVRILEGFEALAAETNLAAASPSPSPPGVGPKTTAANSAENPEPLTPRNRSLTPRGSRTKTVQKTQQQHILRQTTSRCFEAILPVALRWAVLPISVGVIIPASVASLLGLEYFSTFIGGALLLAYATSIQYASGRAEADSFKDFVLKGGLQEDDRESCALSAVAAAQLHIQRESAVSAVTMLVVAMMALVGFAGATVFSVKPV